MLYPKTCSDVRIGRTTLTLGNRAENVRKAKQMVGVTGQLPFSMSLPVWAPLLAAPQNAQCPVFQTKTSMKRKGQ